MSRRFQFVVGTLAGLGVVFLLYIAMNLVHGCVTGRRTLASDFRYSPAQPQAFVVDAGTRISFGPNANIWQGSQMRADTYRFDSSVPVGTMVCFSVGCEQKVELTDAGWRASGFR